MSFSQKLRKIHLITLGTKVLFGVTVVTSALIGALVFLNIDSAHTIEETVDDVLLTRERLSSNLRNTIVELQREFLQLPDFFKSNPQQRIVETIAAEYTIAGTEKFTERSHYKKYFSRRERRDLSKGSMVIQQDKDRLFISYGVVDDSQSFAGTVMRMEIDTKEAQSAADRIKQLAAAIIAEESGEQALARKVEELGNMVAETGLKAEQTRTEILQHVENIETKEKMLDEIRGQQRDLTVTMGIGAIVVNMLIVFLLIRLVIERPLARLTHVIGEIDNGRIPEIPMQKRRDQIGVLSGAMEKFRQVLLEIQEEARRKTREKQIIEDTVATTQVMIDTIEAQAHELADLSENLQRIAETTGTQSGNVARSAEESAGHTIRVADSSVQLEDVMNDIGNRITSQNELVNRIVDKNRNSQRNMEELGVAVREIDSIIALVGDITEQTQLLALNATIEAARAGEAGRGFSIVASEMKELSGKTKQAASDVLGKVEAITAAGEILTHTFNDIETTLAQLNTVTGGISTGISSQQKDVATIRELAARTSANTSDVSISIGQVNEAAGETSALSVRVHDSAGAIASRLAELNEITTKLGDLRENDQPPATELTVLHQPKHSTRADTDAGENRFAPLFQRQEA